MKKKIAVLGAGGTGHTIAADLTLAGFEVTLYEEPYLKESLKAVSERGGIEIRGTVHEGFAKVRKITDEIEEALKDANIVIVAVLASRHQRIAEICAPFLRDGQTIVISPGNAGSLIFATELRKNRIKREITIAELEGNLYSCRLVSSAEVFVALPLKSKYAAAFPSRDTEKIIDELRGIYDLLPATNILEAALNTPNVVIHLAASLLNTGAIEQSGGEYYLYKQGLTPSVLTCVEKVHREKVELFEVLGYVDRSPIEFLKEVAQHRESPELEAFRGLIGPTSIRHRYISEDASTGVSLIVSLGKMLNVPTPISSALITLASAINEVDYLSGGRTLERLGLMGLSVNKLNQFLADGEINLQGYSKGLDDG
jgi:opine dehydrogenase